jgi:hypothetical protein
VLRCAADEKPSVFLELESAIRGCGELAWLGVQTKFARTAIEICPHTDGPESQELFCVRYGCFFNCLPDPTSIKSTRPARPNWAVKITLLTIRGRAHQRDTVALGGPGHFPAWQRQRAVISPGETTADGTRNAYSSLKSPSCSCVSITLPAAS